MTLINSLAHQARLLWNPDFGLFVSTFLSGEKAIFFSKFPQKKSGNIRHTLAIIEDEGNKPWTCLGEDNGHHEEIQEEALRDIFVVKVEKDDCETQVGELVNRVTE